MTPCEVKFDAASIDDLASIFAFVRERAGDRIARAWVDELYHACLDLALFPQRGTLRNDLRPGLRILGYRRRANIVFRYDDASRSVVILGVLYGGRDTDTLFKADTESPALKSHEDDKAKPPKQ